MICSIHHPQPLIIRPIRPEEIAPVVAVLREAAQWLVERGIRQWNPAEFDAALVARWMSAGVVFAAWSNGDVIGTVMVDGQDDGLWRHLPGHARYIHKLAVSRRVAGQGVSCALLQAAEEHIAGDGYSVARLDCWAGNGPLRRFYTGAGYTLRAVVTEGSGDETWECALFEKQLAG